MSDLDQNPKVGTSTDDLLQRRRALLKGSAVAVPAILTLRSGSALAATSISCIQKVQGAIPPETPPTTVADPAADTWLRQSTHCRTLTNGSGTITVFRDPNTPLLSPETNATKWYNINTDTSNVANAFVYQNSNKMKDANGTGNIWDYNAANDNVCYVLMKVNSDGSFPNPQVYGAFTSVSLNSESCMASLSQGQG